MSTKKPKGVLPLRFIVLLDVERVYRWERMTPLLARLWLRQNPGKWNAATLAKAQEVFNRRWPGQEVGRDPEALRRITEREAKRDMVRLRRTVYRKRRRPSTE